MPVARTASHLLPLNEAGDVGTVEGVILVMRGFCLDDGPSTRRGSESSQEGKTEVLLSSICLRGAADAEADAEGGGEPSEQETLPAELARREAKEVEQARP
jgi:hypothetical protein